MHSSSHAARTALVEIGLLFSPAIPAYIWLWPNVTGATGTVVQTLVYLYLLAGCLLIGWRRWTLDQLGLNRRGWKLGLSCGAAWIAMMIVGRLAIGLPWAPQPLTPGRLVFDVVFYFGFVGVTEELLFRGLIYRALYELRGDRLAIWGSALAFGVYHIGGQGLLGGFGTGVFGVMDGAIRWRAGGIWGLVLAHGLYDIVAIEGWPDLKIEQLQVIHIVNPALALMADVLLFGTLIYLWKLHPLLHARITSDAMPMEQR